MILPLVDGFRLGAKTTHKTESTMLPQAKKRRVVE
jgi:hypothetical protein